MTQTKTSKLVNAVIPFGHPGRTSLHLAMSSRENTTELVRLLLQHGADPNKRDCFGNAALYYINDPSDTELAIVLLRDGHANPNLQNNRGWTPLHLAATCWNRAKLARVMLQYGADVSIENKNGHQAVDIAFGKANAAFIRALLANNEDHSNSKNRFGLTLLHRAVTRTPAIPEIVGTLLEVGADTKVTDRRGRNALDLACAAGSIDCIFLVFKQMIGDGSLHCKSAADGEKKRKRG